jgi:thiol-disulfide isomerase/thioredoxin
MQTSRRAFLASGAAPGAARGGCVSQSGSGGTGGGDSATETPTGLTLRTYDVEGSPGESMVVKPAGEPALLDFFATWCAPCKPQMAELRQIRSEYPDLHMLSITWESDEQAIRDFWREYEGTWPVASDTELRTGEEYGIDNLPTLLLLDGEGTEVWRHVGLSAADTIAEKVEVARG